MEKAPARRVLAGVSTTAQNRFRFAIRTGTRRGKVTCSSFRRHGSASSFLSNFVVLISMHAGSTGTRM